MVDQIGLVCDRMWEIELDVLGRFDVVVVFEAEVGGIVPSSNTQNLTPLSLLFTRLNKIDHNLIQGMDAACVAFVD